MGAMLGITGNWNYCNSRMDGCIQLAVSDFVYNSDGYSGRPFCKEGLVE